MTVGPVHVMLGAFALHALCPDGMAARMDDPAAATVHQMAGWSDGRSILGMNVG